MIKFTLSSEEISSNAGFSFVKRLLDSNSGMGLWDSQLGARFNAGYSTSAIVRSMVGMMAAGECDYASIDKFGGDFLFRRLVGGTAPSQETLRQRLGALALRDWQGVLDTCVAKLLGKATLTGIDVDGDRLIPLDIDVAVLEDTASHKEGVEMSYHKVKGYAPIFCYAGREGYMIANELRPGGQHSENGAVGFLKRCVGIMEKAGHGAGTLLVRVDSGHDSGDFIKALDDLKVKYIVKRNLRKESPEQLLDSIRSYEEPVHPRPGKTIYRGIRSDRTPAGYPDYQGFMAVESAERTVLASGERLLLPSVELDSWWTNLTTDVRRCVELYHDHGTSEQFHSELKSDMGIELLPSGSLAVNSLVLGLACLAFDCLRFIGQTALGHEPAPADEGMRLMRHRLRTVLLDYIKVACKAVRHAGCIFLNFGRGCFNFTILKKVYLAC